MGAEASVRRLRVWSAVRWVLVGAICVTLGASGWYFTLFDVYGLHDFDTSLAISILALPAMLLLVVLDFRTITARGVLWTWIVLRAIAVPLLGLGIGSLARVWLVTASSDTAHELFDSHAADYAWQLAGLGAALLAVQPLVGGVRRIAVAVFGTPRQAAAPAEEVPRWPGSPLAKGIAATVAFALLAAGMLTLAGRAYWHVAVDTSSSVPPMVATGTIDGQEILVTSYDERTFFRPEAHVRVAAYDLGTGRLMWDRRLPNDHGIPVGLDAILVDERGAFVRMDQPSRADTWFVLDPRTGDVKATAEERNLQVIDDPGDAARGIPGDVVERYLERDDQLVDDGYDDVFTDDGDLERVFRYDDESLLIEPVTGEPAGLAHGFTLHRICCRPAALEAHAGDGNVLWRIDDVAPSAREVVAATESGRVVMIVAGPESKGRLIITRQDGYTEAVIGDRGWLPW